MAAISPPRRHNLKIGNRLLKCFCSYNFFSIVDRYCRVLITTLGNRIMIYPNIFIPEDLDEVEFLSEFPALKTVSSNFSI